MTTTIPFFSSLSPKQIQQVKQCLDKGGVLAIPTDSYYALAVNPFHAEAVKRLLRIKGERSQKPIPVLIGEQKQLDHLVAEIPERAHTFIKEYWPGLLTLVFLSQPNFPENLTGRKGTIGIRQPGDDRICGLLCQIGPVTGTSANPSGQPPACTSEEVLRYFEGDIELLLDGGRTPGAPPSTVLQVSGEYRILREGAISSAELHLKGELN